MPLKAIKNLAGNKRRLQNHKITQEKRATEANQSKRFQEILMTIPIPLYAKDRELKLMKLKGQELGACSIKGANLCPEGGHGQLKCPDFQVEAKLVTTVTSASEPVEFYEESAHNQVELSIVISDL